MAKTVKERFADKSFDFILPVPMTKKSLRKRGYNQVEILAETLSQKLGIECRKNVLRKIYETDKQHSMSYLMRKGNLTGVFDVSDPELVKEKEYFSATISPPRAKPSMSVRRCSGFAVRMRFAVSVSL